MSAPPPVPDPRRRSNVAVLVVITAALLGGWLVFFSPGLFDRSSRSLAIGILACDLFVLAILWSVLFRRASQKRD